MGSNPILSKVLLSGWRHWGTTGQEGGGEWGRCGVGGGSPPWVLGRGFRVVAAPPELITVPTVGLLRLGALSCVGLHVVIVSLRDISEWLAGALSFVRSVYILAM